MEELDRGFRAPPVLPVENGGMGDRSVSLSGGRSLQCVGRDPLLAELTALLEGAIEGRGGAVVLTGEAGIGKTTVATALIERSASAPFLVAWAACPSEELSTPFGPWAKILESVLAAMPAGTRRQVLGRAGAQVATVIGAPSSSDDPGLLDRSALIHAVVGVFERVARHVPLLLVIDDLGWADVASILLGAALASSIRHHRIAMVATVRSGEGQAGSPKATALSDLGHAARTVTLHGLDARAVRSLVEHAGGELDQLVDLVLARTGGNPFFVTELLRLVGPAQGSDSRVPERLLATQVPPRVSDAIDRSLARLSEPVVELLRAASVLGAEGSLAALGALADVSEVDALELLDAAATRAMVAVEGSHWRFSHALVRDVLYEGVSRRVRCHLHHRALAVVGPGAPVGEQARHALAALPEGEASAAVALANEAGNVAMARLTFEEAAQWYRAGLDVMAEDVTVSDHARAGMVLALGRAQRASGEASAARSSFLTAVELGEGDPVIWAEAALGYADPGADLGLAYHATDQRTGELLERALQALPDDPSMSATRAMLLARLAADLYFSSEPERARILSEEAVAVARRSGSPRALLLALAVHHDAYVVGHVEAATALQGSTRMLGLAREAGEPILALIARRARVFDLLASGDLAAVDAEIGAFSRLADTAGVPALRWWPALWRAMRAHGAGELERAEELGVAAFELGRAFEGLAFTNLSFLAFFLARDRGRLGDLEAATREFAEANAEIPALGAALALVLAEAGKLDEALGALEGLAHDGFARLQDRNWPASWFQLTRVVYLTRAHAHAPVLADLGHRFAGECVMVSLGTVFLGAAELGLAWLADTLDQFDQADEHYLHAEATNQRLGARTWLAQARADHAHLLVRMGASQDRGRAHELATLARQAALSIGMATVAESCDALLAAVESQAGLQSPPLSQGNRRGTFRRDGAVWELHYHDCSAHVAHQKGLGDIAHLLAHPGKAVRAVDLMALQAPGAIASGGDRGAEVLDARARREIRDRLTTLDLAIDQAEADGDGERAALAKAERDELLDHLEATLGLRGRSRRLGDDEEKARKAIGVRVRHAIERVETVHGPLGAHLRRSVDTGRWCVYQPEEPVDWDL
ncbi:MAG TPA: AAA family ATPase [Acidimicrobiales bacterium]|nr:AAA family ATPase [Acidimicrobiales bacterium]